MILERIMEEGMVGKKEKEKERKSDVLKPDFNWDDHSNSSLRSTNKALNVSYK